MEPVYIRELIKRACIAQANAYAPYSKFMVGAALLTKNGAIYVGCNVECADYDGTHAEESALAAMVTAGERWPIAIVIVGALEECTPTIIMPCGKCRQKLYEFVSLTGYELEVITVTTEESVVEVTKLSKLPAFAFGPADIGVDLVKYLR